MNAFSAVNIKMTNMRKKVVYDCYCCCCLLSDAFLFNCSMRSDMPSVTGALAVFSAALHQREFTIPTPALFSPAVASPCPRSFHVNRYPDTAPNGQVQRRAATMLPSACGLAVSNAAGEDYDKPIVYPRELIQ